MEKPLHVLVAEVLGWSYIGPGNSMNIADPGIGYPPLTPIVGHKEPIPHYDTDWAATGPLIERYDISIMEDGGGHPPVTQWAAEADYYAENPAEKDYGGNWATAYARGATPLLAVCNLILALHDAGKLHSGSGVDAPAAAATD